MVPPPDHGFDVTRATTACVCVEMGMERSVCEQSEKKRKNLLHIMPEKLLLKVDSQIIAKSPLKVDILVLENMLVHDALLLNVRVLEECIQL